MSEFTCRSDRGIAVGISAEGFGREDDDRTETRAHPDAGDARRFLITSDTMLVIDYNIINIVMIMSRDVM